MATVKLIAGVAQKKVRKVGNTHCAYAAKYGYTERWTPSQLSGKVIWFRAYKITPKTDNTPLVNNDLVDESGNGYNPTVSGTTAPAYRTNVQNGLPAVQYSGSNGFQFAANPSVQESAFDIATPSIFYTAIRSAGNSLFAKTTTSFSDVKRRKMQLRLDGGIRWIGGADSGSTVLLSSGVNTGVWHLGSVISRANNDHDLAYNGAVTNFTTAIDLTTFNDARMEMGQAFSNGAERLTGYFGEQIIFNTALSSANRTLMDGYMAGVWGITI